MLQACTVDKCTPSDPQCVKDCCHLEGDTPIEIRIAYQPPKPPTQAHGPAHLAGLHPSMLRGFHHAGPGGRKPQYGWSPNASPFPEDLLAGKMPSWGRAADLVRPTLGSMRWSHRTGSPSHRTGSPHPADEFDPAAFAASDEDFHSKPGTAGGTSHTQSTPDVEEDCFFPEVVRSSRKAMARLPEQSTISPVQLFGEVGGEASDRGGVPMWGGMVVARPDLQTMPTASTANACASLSISSQTPGVTPAASARSPGSGRANR